MLYVDTEVFESPIAGHGIRPLKPIPAGTVVANFGHASEFSTEAEYQAAQEAGNTLLIQSGVRWVGQYFLYNREVGNEEYINHSETPNLLYHCGICFAKREIQAGEELTVDYRYFLAVGDYYSFDDSQNGGRVDGALPREALLASGRELLELLEHVEDIG